MLKKLIGTTGTTGTGTRPSSSKRLIINNLQLKTTKKNEVRYQ